MHLGHTSGDGGYLKQGKDYVPVPIEDDGILQAGFSEGEVGYLNFFEFATADMGLTDCYYELIITGITLPTEYTTVDMGLTDCYYVMTIIPENEGDTAGMSFLFTGGVYHESLVPRNAADSAGMSFLFTGGVFRDAARSAVLSEEAGMDITFTGGAYEAA